MVEESRNAGAQKSFWLRALWQGVGILLIAGLCGVLINTIRSDRIAFFADWSPEARLRTEQGESMVIALEEARELCSSRKAVFVDARSSEAYREGHILCARSLPLSELDRHIDSFMAAVPMEEMIITYCDGVECSLSEDLVKELYFRGYDNAKVLINGWIRWVEAGFPVGEGDNSVSPPALG